MIVKKFWFDKVTEIHLVLPFIFSNSQMNGFKKVLISEKTVISLRKRRCSPFILAKLSHVSQFNSTFAQSKEVYKTLSK